MRKKISLILCLFTMTIVAQKVMTPEKLIQLKKVGAKGISKNGKYVIYQTSQYNIAENKTKKKTYKISIDGGSPIEIKKAKKYIDNPKKKNGLKLFSKPVKIENIKGTDIHSDVPKSNVHIYNELNYRHWDTWNDGTFNHVFYAPTKDKKQAIDIMKNEPFDTPVKPFGGASDYIWNNDGTKILYVSKKLKGTKYALSTNTDIYEYDLKTKKTINLTLNNKGYDTHPTFSKQGELAWLQMKRDGYESDKNDIIISRNGKHINLTKNWDGTVNSFAWSKDGKEIYFVAPIGGTVQLFVIKATENEQPKQITNGQFDIRGIVGQVNNKIVVSRCDMNHATELFVVDLSSGKMAQLTHENDDVYNSVTLGKVEKRIVKTTDGKDMVCWVTYPPNFNPNKKYPTLLYCQGGPQGALSQFYSFRWNFQLMSAHGYIVIAPNRRGMPGYGVEWNEQISKDYGGQNMKDYLSAIDDISKEPYVDTDKLGCIGASYGGYSVLYLAGNHNKRFKSFITHNGIFDWKSMYGTTEEMFFVNWDLGGAYWDKDNKVAQKAYNEFNPINYVNNWDTPILVIQGGRDYRVPIGQGLGAFQAAQLKGIKSRLLFFPKENHWILQGQNSLVWHREFYKWLKETL
ncbi:MAG: S9 family peptidase [Tenacibaculum sp.]|nr:S9 family peptidase [Tenacibaculum sp.]